MSRLASKKLSVLTCSSCCLVLIDSAAKPRAEGAGGRPQLQRGEIAAAPVHLHEQRRRRRRLCQRLPQRGGDPEAVDCADREKPQPDARQRLHVLRQPFRPRRLLVGNGGRYMCLADRRARKSGYADRSVTGQCLGSGEDDVASDENDQGASVRQRSFHAARLPSTTIPLLAGDGHPVKRRLRGTLRRSGCRRGTAAM